MLPCDGGQRYRRMSAQTPKCAGGLWRQLDCGAWLCPLCPTRSTSITSAGLPRIMGAIGVNRTLTAVNLESNGLTAEAAGAISSALLRSSSLRVLCIGSNYLGDAGIVALCRGICGDRDDGGSRCAGCASSVGVLSCLSCTQA